MVTNTPAAKVLGLNLTRTVFFSNGKYSGLKNFGLYLSAYVLSGNLPHLKIVHLSCKQFSLQLILVF